MGEAAYQPLVKRGSGTPKQSETRSPEARVLAVLDGKIDPVLSGTAAAGDVIKALQQSYGHLPDAVQADLR